MSHADLRSLNAGYVAEMLESYLDAPGSVPDEWRELFERDPEAVADILPGLSGLLGRERANGGEEQEQEVQRQGLRTERSLRRP